MKTEIYFFITAIQIFAIFWKLLNGNGNSSTILHDFLNSKIGGKLAEMSKTQRFEVQYKQWSATSH